MGTNLGVKAVRINGQPIIQLSARGIQPTVPQGKRLIAIVNNGMLTIAPDVTDPSDYAEIYHSYSQGKFLAMDLYLLDESKVPECPDTGPLQRYLVFRKQSSG